MKNSPLISVIITNYNYGQYIAKAIKSVLNQTYRNIELIIINDGSTDDSDQIISETISKFPTRNIHYINRENKGVVYTRNEGMKVAKGTYISYLDADDYFNRQYISKSYKVAKESGADVIYPNWHYIGEWLGRDDTDFPEFTPELLQLQKLHCTPASLIKKSAIKNHQFEVEKVAEDWDFFIGLSLDGATFKLVKDNPINYRIRQGTRGSRNHPKDDTTHFVDILTKYKNIYGDKVIDPARLVKLRHPNIIIKVLSMRYPRQIRTSIKKDGIRITLRKIVRKFATRNQKIWKTIGRIRNNKYQKIVDSIKITKSSDAKLAVVIHLYYPDRWIAIQKKLANINVPFDLYVSVQAKDANISLKKVNNYHNATNIVSFPNRGRDVLPFMLIIDKISKYNQYEYILKLHSKKSLHRKDGSEWLDSLLDQLIPNDISSIIKTLKMSDTGAIGPADHVVSLSRYMGANKERIKSIVGPIAGVDTTIQILNTPSRYPFFGGTMFWCRVDFLSPLLNSGLTPADFNSETGQVDATTAHAIERILGKILHQVGHKKMYTVNDSVVSILTDKPYTAHYKHVG